MGQAAARTCQHPRSSSLASGAQNVATPARDGRRTASIFSPLRGVLGYLNQIRISLDEGESLFRLIYQSVNWRASNRVESRKGNGAMARIEAPEHSESPGNGYSPSPTATAPFLDSTLLRGGADSLQRTRLSGSGRQFPCLTGKKQGISLKSSYSGQPSSCKLLI